MAPMIFLKSILANEPINIFNYGNMQRDFTYIDDIINAIFKCCNKPATLNKDFDFINPQSSISFVPHRIFNVGNSMPIDLMKFIQVLENTVKKKVIKNFKPIEKGDVFQTYADVSKLKNWIGYSPQTSIESGIEKFVNWYKNYYNLK